MNKSVQNFKSIGTLLLFLAFTSCPLSAQDHWVGTWGTAGQLAESHNNPPSPGLGNNSFRQIVQVSIGDMLHCRGCCGLVTVPYHMMV